MSEARTQLEGALYWIRFSAGTLGAWSTASGAEGVSSSGAVGYVQVGLSWSSAEDVNTIMNRGIPQHHKAGPRQPIGLTVEFLQAITANNPALYVSGVEGASKPGMTFELKHTMDELQGGTAEYYQFHGAALISDDWTDAEEGNSFRQEWRALTMIGPSGSGYLG